MSRLPSARTMKEMFRVEAERLKMALRGEISCGTNENGLQYCPADAEEVHGVILEIFRNAVWNAMEMAASARAMERLTEKYAPGFMEEHYGEYIVLLIEERAKGK